MSNVFRKMKRDRMFRQPKVGNVRRKVKKALILQAKVREANRRKGEHP